jgi:hypothetical protein
MPPGGSLGDCAPLTTRFPPLTRKRAMTNEKYGPTLPTGRYTVADHALGSRLPVRPDGSYFYSTDSHQGTPGLKCITGLPPIRRTISRRKYRRSAAGFPRPRVRLGAPQPAITGRRRPSAARDAPPETGHRSLGCRQYCPQACPLARLPAVRATGRPAHPRGKAVLRILFLSRPTELSADRCVLPRKVWRPILGGGMQSHMGYHGQGGRRMAMRCQLEYGIAFHAIARNNSATVGKSGRPHA